MGLQRHAKPRFVFGQVKSTSENRIPPQIVSTAKGCLKNQMFELRHNKLIGQQLISWLLLRIKNSKWEDAFNEALKHYSDGDVWLVGVLVSGNRSPVEEDLKGICAELKHELGFADIHLMGYYLPFHKDEWANIVYGGEASQ